MITWRGPSNADFKLSCQPILGAVIRKSTFPENGRISDVRKRLREEIDVQIEPLSFSST